MKHRYRVCYVGNDSLEHRMVVRAESRRETAEEAKRREAEFVVSVRMVSNAWLSHVLAGLAVTAFAVAMTMLDGEGKWHEIRVVLLLVVSAVLYVVRLSIGEGDR